MLRGSVQFIARDVPVQFGGRDAWFALRVFPSPSLAGPVLAGALRPCPLVTGSALTRPGVTALLTGTVFTESPAAVALPLAAILPVVCPASITGSAIPISSTASRASIAEIAVLWPATTTRTPTVLAESAPITAAFLSSVAAIIPSVAAIIPSVVCPALALIASIPSAVAPAVVSASVSTVLTPVLTPILLVISTSETVGALSVAPTRFPAIARVRAAAVATPQAGLPPVFTFASPRSSGTPTAGLLASAVTVTAHTLTRAVLPPKVLRSTVLALPTAGIEPPRTGTAAILGPGFAPVSTAAAIAAIVLAVTLPIAIVTPVTAAVLTLASTGTAVPAAPVAAPR